MENQDNIKKIIAFMGIIILVISCAYFILNREQKIYGRVMETTVLGNQLSTLIVHTDQGKDIGFKMTEDTLVFSLIEDAQEEAFKSGQFHDVEVAITYKGLPSTWSTKHNPKMKLFHATDIEIMEVLTEEILLKDTPKIEVWQGVFNREYRLEDGTELLDVRGSSGPDHVKVSGNDNLENVTKEVKQKIVHYYNEQGLLYNIEEYLRQAYEIYNQQDSETDCLPYLLEQSTVPSASNEQVIYFLTSVQLPKKQDFYYEKRIGAAFDRTTGERISNLELFSCPKDQVLQHLLDYAQIEDENLRKEMEAAFKEESIILFPDHLELYFEDGSLPSQQQSYSIGLDYEKELMSCLYNWAVPAISD